MPLNIPARGEKAPLKHSLEARRRIVVGLSWDPRKDKVGLIGQLTNSDSQHDLDITCYVYNEAGEFIDFVGAEAQDSMDQSGAIYHSGDDMNGAGEGDDEFLSAELSNLPPDRHALVFLVEIRSNHNFADIEAPFTRLADGMTNTNLLEIAINHDEAANKKAFVMCAICRNASSETGWNLYNIGEYPNIDQIDDWGIYLAQFVD